jgi:hypothetical protein
LLIATPDNRIFLTDRSTSPLGSITNTRYELDRNNNFSRTEIFTTYPENRFNSNIEQDNDDSLANIFDIFS